MISGHKNVIVTVVDCTELQALIQMIFPRFCTI